MRLLFTKRRGRFTKRQWLAIWAAMVVAEGIAVGAHAFWPVPQGM